MTLTSVAQQSDAPLRARVAEEIRGWMGRRKISGVKLADGIGRSQSYVSRRLTGDVPFDLDDIEAIARVLSVPPSGFLTPDPPGGPASKPPNAAYSPSNVRTLVVRHASSYARVRCGIAA